MAQIQGKDIVVKVREAGTTGAFLQMLCETTASIEMSRPETTTQTKTCGTLRSRGSLEWSVPVEGVVETDPDTGFVSYQQLLTWMTSDVDLEVEVADSNNDIFLSGDVFLSNLNLTAPTDGFASFTATLAGTGNPDVTP
jgi:TP901-1 family phage major tail protein